MKAINDFIKEYCNTEFDKDTGEEIVISSLSAVSIAIEEYAKYYHSEIESNKIFCSNCHKYKKQQGNGILHQLCECG